MNPVTHFLVGWTTTLPLGLGARDRGLLVLASIAPDVDGLTVLADLAAGRPSDGLALWGRYHHLLAHNVGFALAAAAACAVLGRRKAGVAAAALALVHVHFLCDIIGSRGPDGDQWPVPYLLPFSDTWQVAVRWQWALNAWPNLTLTAGLLMLTLYFSWARGLSPLALISARADRALVAALRTRFGQPPRG